MKKTDKDQLHAALLSLNSIKWQPGCPLRNLRQRTLGVSDPFIPSVGRRTRCQRSKKTCHEHQTGALPVPENTWEFPSPVLKTAYPETVLPSFCGKLKYSSYIDQSHVQELGNRLGCQGNRLNSHVVDYFIIRRDNRKSLHLILLRHAQS